MDKSLIYGKLYSYLFEATDQRSPTGKEYAMWGVIYTLTRDVLKYIVDNEGRGRNGKNIDLATLREIVNIMRPPKEYPPIDISIILFYLDGIALMHLKNERRVESPMRNFFLGIYNGGTPDWFRQEIEDNPDSPIRTYYTGIDEFLNFKRFFYHTNK